ncbi:hypothetical protein [Jiangella rhizosphaerae]|uniref:Uncharacterized protein n=1 Tax=Jiangella rhizosphaerae TaxID=2293569 RepID=A0A418KL63_9ACTN|nr:hypothetical protein [Jiangella rhizosphaerae]RIQ18267.1 hypothetical protein DY240_21880 [Jiangella rhizosphaerae]
MNGEPVLFAALAVDGVASYGFACTVCGRRQATQPDTACASCAKPAKRTRRPARKSTAAKR